MNQKETFHLLQPTLSKTYQIENLKILPEDYGLFLASCADIYLEHSGIVLHAQQRQHKHRVLSFNLSGTIVYQSTNNPLISITKKPLLKNKPYIEPLGINRSLHLYDPITSEKIKTQIEIVNTQLDDRFPQGKSKFPQTYLQHYDLLSTSLELNALFYYSPQRKSSESEDATLWTIQKSNCKPKELVGLLYKTTHLHFLNIRLKAESTTATGLQSRKYVCFFNPQLSIELRDEPAQLPKLEQLANTLETELFNHYS